MLADPVGSVLADFIETGNIGRPAPGLSKESAKILFRQLPICREFAVHIAFRITKVSRRPAISCGVKACWSARQAARSPPPLCVIAANKPHRSAVVTFACDSGNKYLSKMFNDNWLADQGIGQAGKTGDFRDLISRRFADQAVVTVSPTDPLYVAHTRMRSHDVSQLPVMQQEKIVGLIDESDLLLAVADDPAGFQQPVERHMIARLVTLPRQAQIEDVRSILASGLVVIVADEMGFHGLITRTDLLNYLRRR